MPFDQFLVLFCALSTCFTTLYSLFLSIMSNLKTSSVPTNIFPKLSSTALHLLFIALNCMTLCLIPSSVCWMACQKVGWPSRIGNSWVHTADCLLAALIWVSLSYLEACFHENLITWGSSEMEVFCKTGSRLTESCWAIVRGEATKNVIMVGVCYRPPNQEEEVEKVFLSNLRTTADHRSCWFLWGTPIPQYLLKGKVGCKQSSWLVGDVRGKLLTQISNDQLERSTWSATNKGELTGEVVIWGSSGHSTHEPMLFRILRGMRKASNRVQTLDFMRAEFSFSRDPIDGILWEAALKGKGAQQTWSLKTTSHRQNNGPSQYWGK